MKFPVLLASLLSLVGAATCDAAELPLPSKGPIKVAFVLSEGATVIDFAGPWEVFQDTMLYDAHGNMTMPFELYTVAPAKTPIHTSGGTGHPGLTITPDYSFADAPEPDVVVVGAQSGGPGLSEWLQKLHGDHKVVMSVCTGAFKLAKAGLLDGKPATTHHWFFKQFAGAFPDVKLQRGVRYVQADPLTFTAGGLSSGVDLALHVVADYYGADTAQKTADYMEYEGTGWKTNRGIAAGDIPVQHQEWSGETAGGSKLLLHVTTQGADVSATADLPAEKLAAIPVHLMADGAAIKMVFDLAGHSLSFKGTGNPAGTEIAGTFTEDGRTTPLTLVQN